MYLRPAGVPCVPVKMLAGRAAQFFFFDGMPAMDYMQLTDNDKNKYDEFITTCNGPHAVTVKIVSRGHGKIPMIVDME